MPLLYALPPAGMAISVCFEVLNDLHMFGNLRSAKGSRKNKVTILGVETLVWQGAKTQEYLDIQSFRNAARRDAWAYKM